MRVRKVIKGIDGFKYEAQEFHIFPTGKVICKDVVLKSLSSDSYSTDDGTTMRRLDDRKHHERQIKGGKWIHISPEEFDYLNGKKKIVKKTKTGAIKAVSQKKLAPYKLVVLTDHFKERYEERFFFEDNTLEQFIKESFNNNFIAQDVEKYNTAGENDPMAIYICSLKTDSIMILQFDRGRYILKTCYRISTTKWFDQWFQDYMHQIDSMLTIDDYFEFKTNRGK